MKTKDDIRREVLITIHNQHRCGIGVSGGVGKTSIGLHHLDEIYTTNSNVKALVVAPQVSIFKSWDDDMVNFKKQHLKKCITYSTYISLDKQAHDYDIIYFDEADCLLYSHFTWLEAYKGRILGLTGTPPKAPENGEKGSERYRMIQRYCPIIYTYTTDEATEDEVLNDYRIIVNLLPLDKAVNIEKKSKTGRKWKSSELKEYQYWSNAIMNAVTGEQQKFTRICRMKSMQGFRSKERLCLSIIEKSTEKALIFANTKVQAARMSKHCYYSGLAKSEKNLQLFSEGKIQKMACVQQLNRGITIPQLREIHVLHLYGNDRQFRQKLFRALRLLPHEIAVIYAYVFLDTIDMKWMTAALEGCAPEKISYIDHTAQLTQ